MQNPINGEVNNYFNGLAGNFSEAYVVIKHQLAIQAVQAVAIGRLCVGYIYDSFAIKVEQTVIIVEGISERVGAVFEKSLLKRVL